MNVKKYCSFFEETTVSEAALAKGLLAARIATAIFFITHGYGKLFAAPGLEGFTGMLEGMGLPLAGLLALLVGIAEFFGGIAILLGVLTRFSAFWLSVISLVAWAMVKGFSLGMTMEMPNGMVMGGGDLDVLALGLTLLLFFTGPGALSVSAKMKKDEGMAI